MPVSSQNVTTDRSSDLATRNWLGTYPNVNLYYRVSGPNLLDL